MAAPGAQAGKDVALDDNSIRRTRAEALQKASNDEKRREELRQISEAFRARGERLPRATAFKPGSSLPAGGAKVVHLIRHGEAEHNRAMLDLSISGKSRKALEEDPAYTDPRLTEAGRAGAAAIGAELRALPSPPALIVVSPMRRALETAVIAAGSPPLCPIVAMEEARERFGRYSFDRRSPISALRAEFPTVDFSRARGDADPLWTPEAREPLEGVARRAQAVVGALLARPEGTVALVAHSVILAALLNAAVDVDDPQLAVYVRTEERRAVVVAPPEKGGKPGRG